MPTHPTAKWRRPGRDLLMRRRSAASPALPPRRSATTSTRWKRPCGTSRSSPREKTCVVPSLTMPPSDQTINHQMHRPTPDVDPRAKPYIRYDHQSQARRDAFDREWNANVAAFRHQRDRVEVNMRTRHESQVEDLRKELETALDAPDARPAKWTPQLVDMRRQQKRAVRERKFGEALDLLKSAEEREAEEVEWHRRKMKDGELLFIWD